LPTGWKEGVEQELAASERLPRLLPGTEITLRNIGDEPLVVLRLTVLPVGQVMGETGDAATTSRPGGIARSVAVDAVLANRGAELGESHLLAVLAMSHAGRDATTSAGGGVAFGRRGPRQQARPGGGSRVDRAASAWLGAGAPSRSPPARLRRGW
jgi:hypothetical protein